MSTLAQRRHLARFIPVRKPDEPSPAQLTALARLDEWLRVMFAPFREKGIAT